MNVITDQDGIEYLGDTYTVSFTGPANADCFFTVLDVAYPASHDPIIHTYGLLVTQTMFVEPTDSVG